MAEANGRRRRFNNDERESIYVQQAGKCAICSVDLEPGFHVDHVIPFSRGGETKRSNGQAVCPNCNLQKSNLAPYGLRAWQESALRKWSAHRGKDFLVSACPGAGKTRFAGAAIAEALRSGMAENVVVVVPTKPLRSQWAGVLWNHYGIAVDPRVSKGKAISRTFDGSPVRGVVITYAGLKSIKGKIAQIVGTNTLVVFDEPHHMGDDASWGSLASDVFSPSGRRLLLTGTPFRTDGSPIPFVSYDLDGHSIPDFDMNYGRALEANPPIVRPVFFERMDGEVTWIDGQSLRCESVRFSDSVPESIARKRNRLALRWDSNDNSFRSEWVHDTLSRADERLSLCRKEGDDNAGALAICNDQESAKNVYEFLTNKKHGLGLDRDDVVLAISQDDDASSSIEDFRAGNQRWIVAVHMVSEGVDIPRLRVGAFLTTVRTNLYFMQVVGRFIRWRSDLKCDQTAYLFIANDPMLLSFVNDLETMLGTAMATRDEEGKDSSHSADEPTKPWPIDQLISAVSEYAGMIGTNGEGLPPEVLEQVAEWAKGLGYSEMALGDVCKLLIKLSSLGVARFGSVVEVEIPSANSSRSYDEIRREGDKLRSELNRLHRMWANEIAKHLHKDRPDGGIYSHLWYLIKSRMGVEDLDQADITELENGLEVARNGINAIRRGEVPNGAVA